MSYSMDDQMDDRDYDERDGEAPLDPTLAALARDYNAPPPPPREAMWTAIAAARGAPPVEVVPITRRRPLRWAAAIAALLALAFAVGRFSAPDLEPALAERSAPDSRAGDSVHPAIPSEPEVTPSERTPLDQAPPEPAPALAAGEAAGESLVEPATADDRRDAAPEALRNAGRLAANEPGESLDRPRRNPSAAAEPPDAFEVAAAGHLSRSEVFLTLFRDAAVGQEAPDLSPSTARQLLVRNRLLLDSPAAEDPRMRQLLQDLELVLVQIAQLPAEDPAEDTDLINDGLEAGDVLTRLRSATSNGVAATLRQGVL